MLGNSCRFGRIIRELQLNPQYVKDSSDVVKVVQIQKKSLAIAVKLAIYQELFGYFRAV